jgi:hypothetical protein
VKPPSANLPTKPTEPTWQDKLASYQTNPNAARTELERAQDKANLQKSTGDTKGYEASTHWINQINTAIGPQPSAQQQQFNEYQKKQMELMNRFEGMMNQPTTYNPEADPRYQAYKKLYEKQAGVASQNAMETFNDRGILNSTVTSDRLGQIQQDAQQNALAAIPDFYAQDQQAQQDRLRNTADLIGMFGDQAKSAYDTNPDNPDNVSKRLSNEIKQMELEQLPEAARLEMKKLQQDVEKGALTLEEARFKIDQLKDPNSPINRKAAIETEIAELELANLPAEMAARLAQIRRQTANIGADNRTPEQIRTDQAKADAAELELEQLRNEIENPMQNEDIDIGGVMKELSNLYTAKNSITGEVTVTNPVLLRNAIIGRNYPDDVTDALLLQFGLEIN